MNGLLLKGNGKGSFTALSILQSGIYIPGNGKALAGLSNKNGNYRVAAAQNRGPFKIYALKRNISFIPAGKAGVRSEIRYKNGTVQAHEFYYGSSFLSQSARGLLMDSNMVSVTITDSKGQVRKIK